MLIELSMAAEKLNIIRVLYVFQMCLWHACVYAICRVMLSISRKQNATVVLLSFPESARFTNWLSTFHKEVEEQSAKCSYGGLVHCTNLNLLLQNVWALVTHSLQKISKGSLKINENKNVDKLLLYYIMLYFYCMYLWKQIVFLNHMIFTCSYSDR